MAKTTRHLTLPVDPGSYRFLPIVRAREKFPSIPAGKLNSPSEKADALQRCVDRLQAQGVDLQGVTAHELTSGNLKSTLMLMTSIRKKYDMDYSEREMMGDMTPMGSPHPSRPVRSTLGQGPSSQHPTEATQSALVSTMTCQL
ncbi:hypothetical protein LSAT2_011112 [Lamellibrachia satsuma]|nr:hypothetical protein LSAT2_011112 [Lamellibrachia satsuma]